MQSKKAPQFDWMLNRRFLHMRNKKYGFPKDRPHMDGLPRAQAKYSPKRADGSTNTRPQERMRKSNER